MKLPDCTILKFEQRKDRIDYQARYRGQDITFVQIKAWTVQADSFDDEIESVMLRRCFDWQ